MRIIPEFFDESFVLVNNDLKALLNQSFIAYNIKMPCWMKCWISSTKIATKKWMKIWSQLNFSSNIFRLIQHNFHVGLVYSLFHPTFHSYDVISNVRTLSFKFLQNKKNHTHQIWPSTGGSDHLNYKNKMHKSSMFIQNFLDCTLILHNEFFYYVLERIQLMSLLYPLLHLTWA